MEAYVFHQNDALWKLWHQCVHGAPVLQSDGSYEYEDQVINLSASTTVVSAKFRAINTTTTLAEITCTKLFGGTNGWVEMAWASDTLDVDAGMYEIQISIDFNGSKVTPVQYAPLVDKLDYCCRLPIRVKEEYADVA